MMNPLRALITEKSLKGRERDNRQRNGGSKTEDDERKA